MSRAPELGDACRPGGSCPECNAPTYYCTECGDVEVSAEGERCDECETTATEDRPLSPREAAKTGGLH